jgi:hypothetical protein
VSHAQTQETAEFKAQIDKVWQALWLTITKEN